MTPSAWLDRLAAAWEARDRAAFVALFTPDAVYHWTPFREPLVGPDAIGAAVQAAFDRQRDIAVTHTLWHADDPVALAHWRCVYTRVPTGRRVTVDGVYRLVFAEDGRCAEFREWWHSDEPGAG